MTIKVNPFLFIAILTIISTGSFWAGIRMGDIEGQKYPTTEIGLVGTQRNLDEQFMCSYLLSSIGSNSIATLTMENIVSTMTTFMNLRASGVDETRENIKARIAIIRDKYFNGVEITKAEAVFYLAGDLKCIENAVIDKVFPWPE